MVQSFKLRGEYRKLMNRLIAEIRMVLHKHDELEVGHEIAHPPVYEHHEGDSYVISDVTINHAIITQNGVEVDKIELDYIDPQRLIYVLEQLELSLESAKKFLAQ